MSEEQVDEALKRLQEGHASLELVRSRYRSEGRLRDCRLEGTLAGKPFAGGRGENYVREVGAGHALPQFEEAVVGLQLGQQQTVQVTYPDNYPNKEIAGKIVDFALTVREIKHKVFPVLDDDFAKDHGEHSSLAELRAAIRQRLENELKHNQDEDLKEKIISRLIESHKFIAPPSMIDRQTRYLMERYQSQIAGPAGEAGDPAPTMEEARKTGPGFYNPRIRDTNVLWRRKLWVAHWDVPRPTLPDEWRTRGQTWSIWQYSADKNEKASDYGVPPPPEADPDLDLNHFNGDAAALEAAFGVKPKPFPVEPPPGAPLGIVRTARETRLFTMPIDIPENQAGILHPNYEFEVIGEEHNGFVPVKAYLPKNRLTKVS